jgi:putative transcriptional regulator
MMEMTISDLVADFPKFNAPVFYGGPVQTDSLHFLHNVGDLLEGSKRITSGVYMGGDWDQLKFLIQQKLIEPKHIRFFVGYSGWTDTQLADECKDGSWILCDMHANYLFNSQPHTLWRTVLQNKGNAYSIIADMNDDNNIN